MPRRISSSTASTVSSSDRPLTSRSDGEVERSTDDGRRREHLGGGLADRRDPLVEEHLDAARDAGRERLVARQRLDDVQRQPLGIGGDGLDDGLRGRTAHRRTRRRDELRDRRSVETLEPDLDDARDPSELVRRLQAVRREILRPPSHEQEDRTTREAAREEGDGLPR